MLDTIVPVRTRLNEHGWKPEEVLIHEHQRRRLLLGWLSHVGQLAAGTAQQIIMVPVYLQFWSTETFSAWLIILAAAALTGPADLGLSGVALNRFLRLRHSPAGEQRTNDVLKRLLGSYLWVMGAGGAVLAAFMGVAAATPVSQLPPVAHVPGFLLALAVVVFAMLLQLPSGLASAMLRARDLAALPARIATWGTILGMLAQLLALWLGGGLVAVACMLGLSLLGQAGFMMFCSLRLAFPWVQIGLRFRNWRDVRRDFGTAWPYGAPTMIDIMLAYAPIIVVSVIVSDVQLIALWGVLRTLVGLCRQLDIQLALPLAAEVGRAQAAGRKVEVSRLVFDGTCMISCITAAVCGALLAFGPQIIDVWTKGRITWDGGLATLLVATAFVAAPNLIAQTVAYYTGGGGVLLRARAAPNAPAEEH